MRNQNSSIDSINERASEQMWSFLNKLRGNIDFYQFWPLSFVILFIRYICLQAKNNDSYPLIIPKGCDFSDIVSKCVLSENYSFFEETVRKIENANPILNGVLSNFDYFSLSRGYNYVEKDIDRKRIIRRGNVLSFIIKAINELSIEFLINRMALDAFIDYFLNSVANYSGRRMGEFYDPSFISELMAKIVGIEKSQSGKISVYDPTCGTASFLISASKIASRKNVHLYGQDINENTAAIAKMNLIFHNRFDFDIEIGDTLNTPKFLDGPNDLKTFDYILCNPPFSQMNWRRDGNENDVFGRWGYTTNCVISNTRGEGAYLLHVVKSLKETGRAACIVPVGVLSRGGKETAIRRYLIEKGFVRAIITLPGNLFYSTSISTCIFIFDKNSVSERQSIFMIDATKEIIKDENKNILGKDVITHIINIFDAEIEKNGYSRRVPVSEIEDNGYNLSVSIYLIPKITIPEGYLVKRFSDLALVLHTSRATEGQVGHVIKIGDLEKEWISVIKNPSDYPTAKVPRGYQKYSSPVLLIARIGGPKATYIMASENNPIYVNNDIVACYVDTNQVDVEYLIFTISSSFDRLSTAGNIPRIAVADLFRLELAIAPRSMQTGIFAEAKHSYQTELLKRNGLEELLYLKKNEFIEELRIKKHNMAQDLAAMRNNVSALKKYLHANNIDSMLISDRRGVSVGAHLDRLLVSMGRMAEGISLLTEDYVFGEPEKLDLVPFLKEYECSKRVSKGTVEFYSDEIALRELYNDNIKAIVAFNKHDLEEVINQILANADKHGFTDSCRTDYKVNIHLGYISEDRLFTIRIGDNGNPLPKGMDTKSYGIRGEKGGINGGFGIGGYRVRVIIEHFGGTFNLTSSKEWPVIVELLIPMSMDDESTFEQNEI